MKKLFHFALIAFTAFSVASCSKSTNDLQPNEKEKTNGPANSAAMAVIIPEEQVSIYPVINQPHELRLGDSKRSVIEGPQDEYVVFYVNISGGQMPDPSNSNKMTFTDAKTNQFLMALELLSYEEASQQSINVPDELSNQTYLFVKIKLGDLASVAGKVISMQADINIDSYGNVGATAKLDRAFIFVP